MSPTGRRHYVDLGLALIDSRRSGEAVRKLVDDAKTALLTGGTMTVFAPAHEHSAEVIELAATRTG